jgi:hypothetical protein
MKKILITALALGALSIGSVAFAVETPSPWQFPSPTQQYVFSLNGETVVFAVGAPLAPPLKVASANVTTFTRHRAEALCFSGLQLTGPWRSGITVGGSANQSTTTLSCSSSGLAAGRAWIDN